MNSNRRLLFPIIGSVLLIASSGPPVWAHQGHHHAVSPVTSSSKEANQNEATEKAHLVQINQLYVARVKPIFAKKCMDCHSSSTHYPWYHALPIAKQIIDGDISEAREHLDLSQDYPFKSHASILEDLDAIEDTARSGSMPPLKYRILHSGSGLTDSDKEAILNWTQSAKKILSPK